MSKQYNEIYNDTTNGNIQNKFMDTIVSQSLQSTSVSSNGYLFNPTGLTLNTGILFNEANTMNFYTNEVKRVGISTSGIESTSVIYCTTGAINAPSYSFLGDTDTGITGNGANEISLTSSGAEGMRVNALGTNFSIVSTGQQIELETPSGDTGIIYNRNLVGGFSRFDIRNIANATTTSRYVSWGYNGQNLFGMYYNGTFRFLKDGSFAVPTAAADGSGGGGTRLSIGFRDANEVPDSIGIASSTMWYTLNNPAGTHQFYTGTGFNPLTLTSASARMNMGTTSASIKLFGNGISTNMRMNEDTTSNYSVVDFANVPNATSTSRYMFMGYSNSESSFSVTNNTELRPRTSAQTDLGAGSLRWNTLYANSIANAQQQPSVSQSLDASPQSISNGSVTTFNPDSVIISAGLGQISYSAGVSTITLAGVYIYSYDIVWAAPSGLGNRRVQIRLISNAFTGSGVRLAQVGYFLRSGTVSGNRMSACAVFYANIGATVRVEMSQTSGATVNLINSAAHSILFCKARLEMLF